MAVVGSGTHRHGPIAERDAPEGIEAEHEEVDLREGEILEAGLHVPGAAVTPLFVTLGVLIDPRRLVGPLHIAVPSGMEAVVYVADGREILRVGGHGGLGGQMADDAVLVELLLGVHQVEVGDPGASLVDVSAGEVEGAVALGHLGQRGGVAQLDGPVGVEAVPVGGIEEGHLGRLYAHGEARLIDLVVAARAVVHHLHTELLGGGDLPVGRQARLVAADHLVELAELAHLDGVDVVFVASQDEEVLPGRDREPIGEVEVDAGQLERRREVVERKGIHVFVERLAIIIGDVFAHVALNLHPHAVQLEVGSLELPVVKLGVGRGEYLEVHLGVLNARFPMRQPLDQGLLLARLLVRAGLLGGDERREEPSE